MQLLPAVGKSMAREEGIKHFETFQLLDPATTFVSELVTCGRL